MNPVTTFPGQPHSTFSTPYSPSATQSGDFEIRLFKTVKISKLSWLPCLVPRAYTLPISQLLP